MPSVDWFKSQLLLHSLLLISLLNTNIASSQVFDERYSDWPEVPSINGRVIIVNDLQKFDAFRLVLAGVVEGKNVVCMSSDNQASRTELASELQNATGPDGSLTTITSSTFPDKLIESAVDWSDCLLIASIAATPEDFSRLNRAFDRLVSRGGTLIIEASVAEQLTNGRLLFPDCIVQFASKVASSEDENAMVKILEKVSALPRTVGISLAPDSALVLSGRKVTCYGAGNATFVLPATETQPARIQSISERQSRRQSPEEYLIDLTQWRRDAIDRDLEPFPSKKPNSPNVEHGTLLIVGGGGSPVGLMDRFIELAGGIEEARLVYVPCLEDEKVEPRQGMVESWRQMGIKKATFIHTKDRQQANSDENFLEPLRDATGVFFGGGRQWNFSDSYYGTEAHRLMKDVLRRGGVIAGSSAGASIQARYLARATPIGNFDIMAFGYERWARFYQRCRD